MANPALENQVLLNRMFADTMDPFNRYFAQQLNLAANDLQRRRMLEDEARQTLTASKVKADEHKFQMDREGAVWRRYMDVEEERSKRAAEVEKLRIERAQKLYDAAELKLDRKEAIKKDEDAEEQKGHNAAYRALMEQRKGIVEKRDRLRAVTREDRNMIARGVAAKYIKNPAVLNQFFPENHKGELKTLLSKYINEDDRENALADFAQDEANLRGMREPEAESYEKELSSTDSLLRGLVTKISSAAHSPAPFPPMPPGFPGTPGAPSAAVGVPPSGPTANMTEAERLRAMRAELPGGGGGNPFVPPAPSSPPMAGPIPNAARYLGKAGAGALDVAGRMAREVGGTVYPLTEALQAPISATVGGAWDRFMLGRDPLPMNDYVTPGMSNFIYGGRSPGAATRQTPPLPLRPPVSTPALGSTEMFRPYQPMPAAPALPASPSPAFMAGMSGAQGPDLGAMGLAQTDLVGMRDMYLSDRMRSGIAPQQAESELKSILARLDTGDGEARKIFQEYHKRWLQKKAMQGVVPQGFTAPPAAPSFSQSFSPGGATRPDRGPAGYGGSWDYNYNPIQEPRGPYYPDLNQTTAPAKPWWQSSPVVPGL